MGRGTPHLYFIIHKTEMQWFIKSSYLGFQMAAFLCPLSDHVGAGPTKGTNLAIPQAYESGAEGHGNDLKSLSVKGEIHMKTEELIALGLTQRAFSLPHTSSLSEQFSAHR